MKTTRRSFLGAVAAFVFGVQAEVFRGATKLPIIPAKQNPSGFAIVLNLKTQFGQLYEWDINNERHGIELAAYDWSENDHINHVTQTIREIGYDGDLYFVKV